MGLRLNVRGFAIIEDIRFHVVLVKCRTYVMSDYIFLSNATIEEN